ncbi:unnamed protein product [Prorocentrum cordatum]|uniref:Uncharacterized protein n=1 Tax=Prorocentrum cordatum TaxID=2364126 RepID=A0ABN9T7H3_9DINO|nr:unnamed protein product [Polarella glacialis]
MGLRSGGAEELTGAAELLKATIHGAAHGAAAGGGSRQVVAAAVAAAVRTVWALLDGGDAACAEEDLELAMRQAAMEPAMRHQMRGARPCGRDRALRNVGAHVDLGNGVEVLQEALSRPQGAQRGGRCAARAADPPPAAGEAAVSSVQAAPDFGRAGAKSGALVVRAPAAVGAAGAEAEAGGRPRGHRRRRRRAEAATVGSGPQEGDGSGCSLSTVGSEQELEDGLKERRRGQEPVASQRAAELVATPLSPTPRAEQRSREPSECDEGELRDVDGHDDAEQRRQRSVNWDDGGSEGSVQSVKIGRQALSTERVVACVLATQLRPIGSTVSSSSAFLSLGGCVKNAARVVEMLEKRFGVSLPSSAESDLLLARAGWQTVQDIAD